jgi:type IV pilus assembly protein PilA
MTWLEGVTMYKHIRSELQRHNRVSLLEWIIVVAIMGVLAVVAVPAFSSYRDRARLAALIGAGNSVRGALASLAAGDADSLYPTSVTIETLNAGGVSLLGSVYTIAYTQTGTPVGSSYTLVLEHSATGKQVCVTPERTQKTAAWVCS